MIYTIKEPDGTTMIMDQENYIKTARCGFKDGTKIEVSKPHPTKVNVKLVSRIIVSFPKFPNDFEWKGMFE